MVPPLPQLEPDDELPLFVDVLPDEVDVLEDVDEEPLVDEPSVEVPDVLPVDVLPDVLPLVELSVEVPPEVLPEEVLPEVLPDVLPLVEPPEVLPDDESPVLEPPPVLEPLPLPEPLVLLASTPFGVVAVPGSGSSSQVSVSGWGITEGTGDVGSISTQSTWPLPRPSRITS